VFKNTEMFN
jgi:V-type H+-transporting ATPase subunit B